MAAAIGEPVTDPHGAPIPTRDGVIDETRTTRSPTSPAAARARVVRVGDENDELLRYLDSLGIGRACVVGRGARRSTGRSRCGSARRSIGSVIRSLPGSSWRASARPSPQMPSFDDRPERVGIKDEV